MDDRRGANSVTDVRSSTHRSSTCLGGPCAADRSLTVSVCGPAGVVPTEHCRRFNCLMSSDLVPVITFLV